MSCNILGIGIYTIKILRHDKLYNVSTNGDRLSVFRGGTEKYLLKRISHVVLESVLSYENEVWILHVLTEINYQRYASKSKLEERPNKKMKSIMKAKEPVLIW